MATQNDFTRSFPVNTPMSAFLRVSLSANGGIGPSGTEQGLGILQQDVQGLSYENPKVRFYGTGSCRVAVTGITTTAVTPGITLFTAAGGYVSPTGSTAWGISLDTVGAGAGNNGVTIEALPLF